MTTSSFVVRRGERSVRVGRRSAFVLGSLALLVPAVLLLSVMVGEYALSAGEVLGALTGSADGGARFVVVELRLPRALVGALAGASLGVAGALFQEVTRNPLVSPDVVGVTHGAAAAAAAVIVLTPWDGPIAVPLAALGGAIVAGGALFGLSWRSGLTGARVVLIGIGLAALMHAAISFVLTKGRIFEVSEAYVWLVGTVNGRAWEQVAPLAIGVGVFVPLAAALGRRVDALALGDDLARNLGVAAERARGGMLLLATVLAAAAVAAAGPIGFVAFLAPHLARRLLRSGSAQPLVPAAAGVGALLVLVADLTARLMFAPTELPVGLVTSIIAAPYFLWLLHRAGRSGVAS